MNPTNDRKQHLCAGRRLEYFTLGWNLTEAAVAVGAGVFAGSIALIGFGIDSLIESLPAGILLWRLHATDTTEKRERLALRFVGVSFFVLPFYVAFEAGKSLLRREEPKTSVVGIALSIVSLIVMPLLARAKRRVAAKLDSRALRTDSRQTDICAYLSAILLSGLLLNALFGWSLADPIAAVCMWPLIFAREWKPCATGHPATTRVFSFPSHGKRSHPDENQNKGSEFGVLSANLASTIFSMWHLAAPGQFSLNLELE